MKSLRLSIAVLFVLISFSSSALIFHGVSGLFYSYHNGSRDLCNMNLYSEKQSEFDMQVTLRTNDGEEYFFDKMEPMHLSGGGGINEAEFDLGFKGGYQYYLRYHVKDGLANYGLFRAGLVTPSKQIGYCYHMDLLNVLLTNEDLAEHFIERNPYVEVEILK